jgi:hypothetical protein
MKTTPMPIAEVTATAIALLCREIGPVKTARFINHFSNGFGNYTEERDNLLGNPTVKDLVNEIEARRGSSGAAKKRQGSGCPPPTGITTKALEESS